MYDVPVLLLMRKRNHFTRTNAFMAVSRMCSYFRTVRQLKRMMMRRRKSRSLTMMSSGSSSAATATTSMIMIEMKILLSMHAGHVFSEPKQAGNAERRRRSRWFTCRNKVATHHEQRNRRGPSCRVTMNERVER